MEREKVHKLLNDLHTVFNHYGLEAQLGQLGEECNELAIAAHHYQRVIGNGNKTPAIIKEQKRNEMVLEIADVLNVIEQIAREMNLTESVNNVRCRKMEREVKRIQESKQEGPELSELVEKIIDEIDKQSRPMTSYGPATYVSSSYLTYLRNKLAEAIRKN